MRIGFFGPEGTFTHEAMLAATEGWTVEPIPLQTIYDAVQAVQGDAVERALVPIENAIEGSVDATLDALALESRDVVIVGEVVHPIRQRLIAREPLNLEQVEVVVSHPQAMAQCARFLRTRLPQASVMAGGSTAEAVRTVVARSEPWAALGNRAAAELYGGVVLCDGVEDVPGNETRFAWLGRRHDRGAATADGGAWKTALVFWGAGSETPGWLVRCLAEFARREVNLTRIESRPRRQGMGRYMFFVDLEGHESETRVSEALSALRTHVEVLRVLGSFPAA